MQISESTLEKWVRTADREGFDPQRLLDLLRAVRPVRGNVRLSEQQKSEVREVLGKSPESFGYRVWDGPSLSDFIAVRYRMICSVRECVRILREAEL